MPICARCGRDNPEGFNFCGGCGAPLTAPAHGREERKIVTVLFADLVGFTSRAERLDPEDVRGLLAPYWERVRAELQRHGGTVEKFIGDAVMALFGAPAAHEDDPERAVRAALAIRDWIAGHGEDLQARIAVTTGEALVRLGARPLEGEGMASGDVVNTAARLQAAAPVNGVLVGEATFRATRHTIEYREAPPVVAKGKAEPVRVWEAVEARSRLGVDVEQRPRTPLVGREREFDELRGALARARHDRAPQLVTLVGVPGIGKTRLVHELFRAVEAEPEIILWRQGRSLPYGEGVSFWALSEMVKGQAGILETDAFGAAEEKLRRAVEDAVEDESDRLWIGSRLRPLVGVPGEDGALADRRSEFFAAWRRFLEGLAERHPLVLVFEDLHWADDDLLDFVDHLADWVSGVPLLVVGTARPELLDRRPGWGGGKRNAATLSLAPLADSDTARLLGALLRRAVLPVETQSDLLLRAGGNPLYAEQYALMLEERGEGRELAVPETVQGIIAARLDALGEHEKGLLQDGAVLGKVFWTGALATIGGADPHRAEELLHGLERKEFVQRARRSSVAGESEYAFGHLLVRDVAYNQIPRAARAEKHRRAAEWIGSLARPEDHADLLAHHYLSALELARAAGTQTAALRLAARSALAEAGDRAAALNALTTAARFYAAALELWEPNDPAYPRLLFRLARSHHESGRPGNDVLLRARDVLLDSGDVDAAAEIVTRLAHATWIGSDHDGAMAHLDQAMRLVRNRPSSDAQAFVLGSRARFHMLAGQSADALAVGAEALAMAAELGLEELRAQILNTVGVARVLSGDADRGIADLKEAIAIAEALNAGDGPRGYVNLASCLWTLGDWRAARSYREQGLELARQFGNVSATLWLTAELALDRYHAGEWDAALATADEIVAAVADVPLLMEAPVRAVRGWIGAARGDVAGAVSELERGLEVGRSTKEPQALFPALAFHAQMLLEAGRDTEAAAIVDELLSLMAQAPGDQALFDWGVALALALRQLGRSGELQTHLDAERVHTRWTDAVAAIEAGAFLDAADALVETGDFPHEARVRVLAAEELAAAGRRADADEQLARALAFYRSVGATRWITRAETLLPATA